MTFSSSYTKTYAQYLHHMFFRKLLWLSHFPSAKILFRGRSYVFRLADDFLNTLYSVRKSWVPWETLDHCYYYTLLRTKAYKGTPTLLLLRAKTTKKSRSSCTLVWYKRTILQFNHKWGFRSIAFKNKFKWHFTKNYKSWDPIHTALFLQIRFTGK